MTPSLSSKYVVVCTAMAVITSLSAFSSSTNHHNAMQGHASSSSLSLSDTAATVELKKESCTLDGKKIRGPITPLGNFILVRTKDTLSATDGGILLPDQAKECATEGKVVAAGPGKLHPHTGV